MKKLMYFAAALLVLVGCNKKDNALNNAPEGTPFEKGQKVTLTIGTGAQQGPNKVAGVDAGTQINFTWEEGDQILVKVDDKTAVFTLTTGAGSNSGEFAGEMPAASSTFGIQYPITEPDLTAQVYTSTEPIPADKMLFKKKGCTLGESATLSAQYAIVQLNLYGTDKTVGKIVFTKKTADPAVSYTLTCTDGKTIGTTSAEATPFYMVVPTGEYQFEVEVYDNATTPAEICSFATSAAQTFTQGGCLNMSAKEVKAAPAPTYEYVDLGLSVKWATMNVGATKPEEYGDYFAWGETAPHQDNNYSSSKYTYTGNPTTLPLDHDAARVNWGGNWRMPTIVELAELSNQTNCQWVWLENYNSTGVKGCLVTSNKNGNSIFLPASGYRYNSSLDKVGSGGRYWTSSLYEYVAGYACSLYFNSSSSSVGYGYDGDYRYYGYSVRPVCQ